MADLAVIGIEARSDSLVTATDRLDKLGSAARKAEDGVDQLGKTTQQSVPKTDNHTKATYREAMAAQRLARQAALTEIAQSRLVAAKVQAEAASSRLSAQLAKQAAAEHAAAAATERAAQAQAMAAGRANVMAGSMGRVAANTNLASHQVGNLAAQVTDVGVSLASGMNPFLVMLQQGTQIAQVFGPGTGVGGILKGLVQTIGTMVRPFLPVIAVAGLLGAALGTVKDDAQRMTSATVGWGHMIQGAFAEAGARIHAVMKPAFDFIEWGFGEVGKAVIYAGNLIINSFRAAYNDIVFIFNAIPLAIEGSIMAAVNGVIRGVNLMVTSAAVGINKIIEAANALGANLSPLPTDNPLTEKPNNALADWRKLVDKRNADTARIMGEDPLGGFLRGAAGRAAKFAEEDAAKVGGRKGGGKSEAERYAEIVKAQRQSIEMMKLEAQTMFMTEEAASRLRIEQELLNKAANDNIKLTPQQTAELKALAAETAAVEASTKALKDAMDFAKDVTGGFFADLKNGLMQGKTLWESFGDAAMNVLNKILDKMLELAVNSLFTSGTGGTGGFLASLFSGLTSMFGGGGPLNLLAGMRANGGPVHANKPYLVGERGPEIMVPTNAGYVVPNHAMRRQSGNVVSINFAPVIDARGADPAQISMLRAEMRAQAAAMPKVVDSRINTRQSRGVRA